MGRWTHSAQAAAAGADQQDVRTTPPPLRRRVEGRAAALADEVKALAERSSDLLARIDDLCAPPSPTSGPRR